MAIVSGEVKVVVTMKGEGNAAAVVDKTADALKRTETASKGAVSGFGALKESLAPVADKLSGVFGGLSKVANMLPGFGVGGLIAAAVGGLAALVESLTGGEEKLSSFGEAMSTSLVGTFNLATGMSVLAAQAQDAAKAIDAMGKVTIETYAKIAESRGDTEGAKTIRQFGTSVDLDKQAAEAENFATTSERDLARAKASSREAQDRIDNAFRNIEESQLLHEKSSEALARGQLAEAKIAKEQADKAIRELSPLVGVAARKAAALRARADEEALKANRLEGTGFFEPTTPTTITGPGAAGGLSDDAYTPGGYLRSRERDSGRSSRDAARDFRMLMRKLNPPEVPSAIYSTHDAVDLGDSRPSDLANQIRDFTSALSDAMPGMGQFNDALSKISDIWTAWGKTGKETGTAIVGSLAAIGLAGAAEIKNDRLRAGVKAIIYGAEGAVHLLTPGMQALGAAEIGAAVALGGIAIFGGSGGGGGARSSAPQRVSSGRDIGGGPININIYGGWFGAQSPQENGAALEQRIRRAQGTGFERRDAA